MPKRSDAETVAGWMAALDAAQRPVVAALRRAICQSAPELAERIKWNAPSYHLDGLDMAAMNLRDKAALRLVMVYPGAAPAERHGLLEGEWPDRRIARYSDADDVEAKHAALAAVIADWMAVARAASLRS